MEAAIASSLANHLHQALEATAASSLAIHLHPSLVVIAASSLVAFEVVAHKVGLKVASLTLVVDLKVVGPHYLMAGFMVPYLYYFF